MVDDIRFALRQLWKNPGFAGIAVATLGLGIGAAAAIFGLIQSVLLSPPPYAQPDRLVLVAPARADGQPFDQGVTTGEWLAWRRAKTFDPPALYQWTFNFLVRDDGSESLGGMRVTRNYFRVLEVHPILGREFTDTEIARPNTPPSAVILGYDLWQRRFSGNPGIIGTTIRISRQPSPLTVVGVMPRGVRFLPDPQAASEPNYDVNARVDFWMAFAPDETQPKRGSWNAIARLRNDATSVEAQAEAGGIVRALATSDSDLQGLTATVRPIDDVLNQDARRLLVPLFGSVVLVFLIACANVAGLLVARGLQRQQEYAMRSALGAGRGRLFRQVLTESVTLAFVSAVVGAGLAAGLIAALKTIGADAVPRADAVHVGWPVFVFGAVAALLAAVIAGVLPALRASTPDRVQLAKGGRTSAGRAERRLLGAVATMQIVLTVALLGGAALLVRTAQNLSNVRAGYDTENILAMTVTAMTRGNWKGFHTQALERVSALPGVRHAAFAWGVPLTGNKWPAEIERPGQPASTKQIERVSVPLRSVTADYFAVMGMRIVEGRGFTASDQQDAAPVVVVNETFARRYFGRGAAVGQELKPPDASEPPRRIVGIVADARTESLSEKPSPEVYVSFWQNGAFSKHLVLRTAGDPGAIAASVRRELTAIDPTAAVEHLTTMTEIRRESLAPWTFAMQLLTGFGAAATFLSLVGVYGVLSLSVGSRTKEIGVRKAIGAQGHQIVRLVLGEGSAMIAAGLVIGTFCALLLGRLLEALLFDVKPADPLSLAGSALTFGVVALVVCLLPAFRARALDVMEALRQE
jgi:putative ABC transport system permease protein